MYGVRGTITPHLKSKKQSLFENKVIKTVVDRKCIYLRLTIAKNYKHIPQIRLVTFFDRTTKHPESATSLLSFQAISRDQITDSQYFSFIIKTID